MKIYAYSVRPDEEADFNRIALETGADIFMTNEIHSIENSKNTKGYDAITILGYGNVNSELLDIYKENGIKFISTRTIGYNHIDVKYANKIGIKVCNANYAPNGVADFTVMMMLMCIRNFKKAMWRGKVNDFSLRGLQGREMKDLTIGIIGTGKIGLQVLKNLSGFGSKLLAYDIIENSDAKKMATYVNLDTLLQSSDVISLHMPLLSSTYHIIDADAIDKMKKGVVIVNCARGELCNLSALVAGIESEKIGALGLDTIEGEENIMHKDRRLDTIANRDLFYLHQFGNVIWSQHMAFYTDVAVSSMVECGIYGIFEMQKTGTCATEIVE